MEMKINSRKLDKTLIFSRPGSHYIYVDLNGQPGTLGNELCNGGYLRGDTIGVGDSQEEFERLCRKWYRAFIRREN